jgi:L-proline amide hydrolase
MASTDSISTLEGEVDFSVPSEGKPWKTWYKIIGTNLLNAESGRKPVIAIHGGPGLTHHLLTSFTDLTTQYVIPVIFYDQLDAVPQYTCQRKPGMNPSGQKSNSSTS